MNQLIALFLARTKEYYRDRGSLVWSFIMPPLIIAVVALAFSKEDPTLFKVGYYPAQQAPAMLVEKPYLQLIPYEDETFARQRVEHHQLDLLIYTDGSQHYLYNPASIKAAPLQELIQQASEDEWKGEALIGQAVRYVDWVIPGILAMNLMFSGLFGVGYVIVRYRKNGVLKRLQAAPVSPLSFLSAQLLSRLVIMLCVSVLVYSVANAFLGFLMLGSYWTLLLIALLGNLCILALGLVVASRLANEEVANGVLNLITFPMLLLSEVWFSLDGAPAWMSSASQFLPLTHMVQAARSVMIDGAHLSDISHHLFMLIIMTAVLLLSAAKLFRWRAH